MLGKAPYIKLLGASHDSNFNQSYFFSSERFIYGNANFADFVFDPFQSI